MITALLFACLAAFPVSYYGVNDPLPAGQEAHKRQTSPVAESPKATIPAPAQSDPAKPAADEPKPSVDKGPETDPAKIAAPAPDPNAKPAGATPALEHTYLIGAQDILGIVVWGNQALTGPAMVRSDGKITVALIGEVVAAGQTPEKISEEITERLKSGGFLLNPKVTVSVTEIKSKNFFIQGEVNKPGRYSLIVPMTVLEALVNAGGFRDFANKKDIRVIRGDKQFKFNYNQVIKGKNRDQNILLQPGDLIVVR